MVHRRIKGSGRATRGVNPNRSWIWGRHVVAETLRAARWPVRELALGDTLDHSLRRELLEVAQAAAISVTAVNDARLTQLCRAADHQGCAALMGEFPYQSEEQFLQALSKDALILVLDRIQDPFNFGAIIRSAECLGMSGVLIGTAEQASVNSQVARSSAGAVNYLPIARVDDLTNTVAQLARRGWQICGATERGESSIEHAEFRAPLALVIGNEGAGLRTELSALCTLTVRIPMQGCVSSLNAAVSAGILCYAAANYCRVNRDR